MWLFTRKPPESLAPDATATQITHALRHDHVGLADLTPDQIAHWREAANQLQTLLYAV